MHKYVRFKESRSEKWQLVPSEQEYDEGKRPLFSTALEVDCDPEMVEKTGQDALEVVKYAGPMYFDLDNEHDIESTIRNGKLLAQKLVDELNIPTEFINCWLSGKKGLHFTVAESVFGQTKPRKLLPWIYQFIAQTMYVDDLDMGVYSTGRGRMWRTENVKRPNNCYKVPISFEELMGLNAEAYGTMVSAPREDFARAEPAKSFVAVSAKTLFDRGVDFANKKLRAYRTALQEPIKDLSQLPSVPGCINKLITVGDCDDSNYNQAAMQVACWIAARFDKVNDQEQYEAEIITPFLNNVTSSSRGSISERRSHLKSQMKRAFQGNLKFGVGALIKTIGTPCGECELCRADLRAARDAGEVGDDGMPEVTTDPDTNINMSEKGWRKLQANSFLRLSSFRFVPEIQYNELYMSDEGLDVESARQGMLGTLIDDSGTEFKNFDMPEKAWKSRAEMMNRTHGYGTSVVFCSDQDLSSILRAVLKFHPLDEMQKMTYTSACGLYLEKHKDASITPHYVEEKDSIMGLGAPSRLMYHGPAKHVPKLLTEQRLVHEGDAKLVECLNNISMMNETHNIAIMLGWLASNHLREHINSNNPEYPLLNVCGNSGAGKSASTRLLCMISGLNYNAPNCEPLSMESSTAVPLYHYVSNSTTVVRLIEEANESQMKREHYKTAINVFKAAWDRTAVQRGTLNKNARDGVDTRYYRVTAPLLFISEQKPSKPAIQERSLTVMMTKRGRDKPECRAAFRAAQESSDTLLNLARSLMEQAMQEDPRQYTKSWLEAQFGGRVPTEFDDRPRYSFLVVFMGLAFLRETLHSANIHGFDDRLLRLELELEEYLAVNTTRLNRAKKMSEVDLAIKAFNDMAGDREARINLVAGEDYVRHGNFLHLRLSAIMPRYNRFMRDQTQTSVFRNPGQLSELLEGESYFDRTQVADNGAEEHVLNVELCLARGIPLHAFKDDAADESYTG